MSSIQFQLVHFYLELVAGVCCFFFHLLLTYKEEEKNNVVLSLNGLIVVPLDCIISFFFLFFFLVYLTFSTPKPFVLIARLCCYLLLFSTEINRSRIIFKRQKKRKKTNDPNRIQLELYIVFILCEYFYYVYWRSVV